MKISKKQFVYIIMLTGAAISFWLFLKIESPSAPLASINPEEIQELILSEKNFSFNIFREIIEKDFDNNIFISPLSINMALLMVYNGAKEETKQEIAETLGVEKITQELINKQSALLLDYLEGIDPKVKLLIANSIWMREDESIDFQEEFIQIVEDFYRAEAKSLNFNDPNASSIINKWVSDNTNKKIEKIIDNIEQNAIVFILNAIYFKGDWTIEFDKNKTEEKDFTLLDGTKKKHPLMSNYDDYLYYENDNFQAINLPYGNERMSMYVFLPREDYGLNKFYENLTSENWNKWLFEFRELEGTIALPRFKVEYDIELKDILKNLGMNLAFDKDRANFQDLATSKLGLNIFIEKVKHKTFVKVNEEGTEAAAVTSVEFGLESVSMPKTFFMSVDRPFFFTIQDNITGTIIFMGSVVNPEE